MTTIDLSPNPSPEARRNAVAVDLCTVICTHDRPDKLRRALDSLMAQTIPPAEILVVDNAPPDDRTLILVHHEFPAVRYIREPILGLDFARNRALRESTQVVVAFLDDDAIADRHWAETFMQVFRENPEVAACTGRVLAFSLETDGQRLFEANGGFSRGEVRIRLPHHRNERLHGRRAPLIAWAASVGSGCSLAVKRSVALRLGKFDEALDMGSALPGGGDYDMLWRVLRGGFEVIYEPKALAWHEHRQALDAAFHQIIGHQRALIAVLTKTVRQEGGQTRLAVFAFLIWRLLKPGVRLYRRMRGRDPLPVRVLLRMWWHCWRGLGSYPAAKRLARHRSSETEQLQSPLK